MKKILFVIFGFFLLISSLNAANIGQNSEGYERNES